MDKPGRETAEKLEFKVTGTERLHCSSCERVVTGALRRLPGVEQAWASALSQRIVVTVDPGQVSPEQVQAALAQLWYQVTPKETMR